MAVTTSRRWSDIEEISGSDHNDVLIGSAAIDRLFGGGGDDTIDGAAGNDELDGGGNDAVRGDAGNDRLLGGYGDDSVDGGAGVDSMFGDLAACSSFSCPSGNDSMFARDAEADSGQCGAGADKAQVDAVAQDGFEGCESLDRLAAPPRRLRLRRVREQEEAVVRREHRARAVGALVHVVGPHPRHAASRRWGLSTTVYPVHNFGLRVGERGDPQACAAHLARTIPVAH